ncbi:MAG: succinate dehydrogenase cytochrome b subunit [Bacteroidales bacterium]|jgi:succinate dehydrogenase / fumarate reductase cytochrome b subunit|nr:succinate dehydrogenase cytochrome b subunit [Bacteroidales bacterium]
MKFFRFASVTKKITLAIMGLFLIVFLLLHGAINLCLLRSDGGEWFKAAAHFMGTNWIVKVMEIVLMAAFLIHIILAVTLQIQNWLARPIRYRVATKSKTSLGSKLMIYTGLMVLCFLCIHFMDFYFVKLGLVEGKYQVEIKDLQKADTSQIDYQKVQENWVLLQTKYTKDKKGFENLSKGEMKTFFGDKFKLYEPDFYLMAKEKFHNVWYVILYVVLIFALCLHLNHALQSAFQTLGLNHRKYTPFIKLFSTLYALLILGVFAIIPVWIYFFDVLLPLLKA